MANDTYKTKLPWILGAIFVVLYILTLNKWIAVDTLGIVAPIVGWDFWSLQLQNPIYRLITTPFRYFPSSSAIIGLNFFNTILATFTIIWLARSVMLLPQDRSTDQRVRNDDPDGLYISKFACIPPIIACISLGLLFNFWQGATEATPDILNVFFFAYIVRNTLEHRLDGESFWIYRASTVYSIALVNNPMMVLFLPFWIGSLIWINGKDFLKYGRLILNSILCFLPGLLFFLYTPIAEYIQGHSDLSFLQLLSYSLSTYVNNIASIPAYVLFIYSTFSIIPIILLSVHWDSSHSGSTDSNVIMTRIGVRLMNIFFFIYSAAVASDLPLCPRYLLKGYNGLELHFLAALTLGFTSGYLLVVFHEQVLGNRKKRFQVSAIMSLLRPVVTLFVLVSGVALAGGLFYKNLPDIKANSSDILYKLGSNLTADIQNIQTEKQITLFSDDPISLNLTIATMVRQKIDIHKYIFVYTQFLSYPWYHRRMATFYPDRWTDHFSNSKDIKYLEPDNMSQWMLWYAGKEDVYYLHPSFGHFFEACKPTSIGLLTHLTTFKDNNPSLWKLTSEEQNHLTSYWKKNYATLDSIPALPNEGKKVSGPTFFVSAFYSRALTASAVELCKSGDKASAITLCQKAFKLFPQNISAFMNQHYYQTGTQIFSEDQEQKYQEMQNNYNGASIKTIVLFCGPFDTPAQLFELGRMFSQNLQWRQAFQCFLRVQEYEPNNIKNLIFLAYTDSMVGESEHALQLIHEAKAFIKKSIEESPTAANVPSLKANLTELDTQEAACLLTAGKIDEALSLLTTAFKAHSQDNNILNMLIRAHIAKGNFDQALPLLERILAVSPDNKEALTRKALCLMGLNHPQEALIYIDNLLRKNPLNSSLHLLRITACVQLENWDEAIAEYKIILEQNKDNLQAMMGIADLEAQQGNLEESLKWADTARTNKNASPEDVQWIEKRIQELKNGKTTIDNSTTANAVVAPAEETPENK